MLENLDYTAAGVNCLYSLSRVGAGVVMALVVGVALGLGRSKLPPWLKRNRLLKFLLEAPKFPPPIAWIPFVIIWLGIGEFSAWIIVFIGAVSPIFTSTYEGAEAVSPALRNCARSLEVRGFHYLLRIIFPAALPQIFTGVRVGVSMGWMSVIAAEMISGQSGLGYSIQMNRLNMQYDLMTVDMVLIGIIGFLLHEATVLLQRQILPWHEGTLS
jgi:sulfonate transport system permease protein